MVCSAATSPYSSRSVSPLFGALFASRLLVHFSTRKSFVVLCGGVGLRLGYGRSQNSATLKLGDEGGDLDLLNDDLVRSDKFTDIFAAWLALLLAAILVDCHLFIAANLDRFLRGGTMSVVAAIAHDHFILAFFLNHHMRYLLAHLLAFLNANSAALFDGARLEAFHVLDMCAADLELIAAFLLLGETDRLGAILLADFASCSSSGDGEEGDGKE